MKRRNIRKRKISIVNVADKVNKFPKQGESSTSSTYCRAFMGVELATNLFISADKKFAHNLN